MAFEEVTVGPNVFLPLSCLCLYRVGFHSNQDLHFHTEPSVFISSLECHHTYVICTLFLACPLLVGRAGVPGSGVQVITWDK